jgi:MtN3 and saliva related transmembrane protein
MDWVELSGLLGSALSSITFVPQVYKTWKSRRVNDLSLAMMLIVFVSTIVWLIYGSFKGLLPVIICNSIICFLSLMLIAFKLLWTNKTK